MKRTSKDHLGTRLLEPRNILMVLYIHKKDIWVRLDLTLMIIWAPDFWYPKHPYSPWYSWEGPLSEAFEGGAAFWLVIPALEHQVVPEIWNLSHCYHLSFNTYIQISINILYFSTVMLYLKIWMENDINNDDNDNNQHSSIMLYLKCNLSHCYHVRQKQFRRNITNS